MVRQASSPGQGELLFDAPAAKAPTATAGQVAALAAVLATPPPAKDGVDRRGWWTAEELAARLGDGWSDRLVRAVARASAPGIVSFPGSPGYKLWATCTVQEITQAVDAFKSQARDMAARASLYEDAYHRRFRS